MYTYYTFLQVLAVIFTAVMIRHCYYRSKFFLHVFQQVGYKTNEYRQWVTAHWDDKIMPRDLGLMSLVLFAFFWVSYRLTNSAVALILFCYGIFWFASVKNYKQDQVKKPLVFTSRMKRLTVPFAVFVSILPLLMSFISLTGALPFTNLSLANYEPGLLGLDVFLLVFGWVFGSILIPFMIFLAAGLMQPFENRIQEGFKRQARQKLASMSQLKVIAITGSYGKTSTKFMIRDLLQERFNVCATPGSYNTPMGICKVINNDLQAAHQVLILEMGARYPGNIQELCDIARPDISVVTNVGVAHLETFGSQDVIAREKSGIIKNLKPGGVAVLNADDPRVSAMGGLREDISVITAGLEKGQIKASGIKNDKSGTHFRVETEDGESEAFRIKLLGRHNVQNLLLAAGVARHLGIRLKTMALAASRMEPVEHRLELKEQNGFYVIDDAFNSNPVGARNAVEILSSFEQGKRIIITPGMIELGEIEEEENREFGRVIGRAGLDHIILVGPERTRPILEGIKEINGQAGRVRVVNSLFEANNLLKEIAAPGDVVLYENDLPDVYDEK